MDSMYVCLKSKKYNQIRYQLADEVEPLEPIGEFRMFVHRSLVNPQLWVVSEEVTGLAVCASISKKVTIKKAQWYASERVLDFYQKLFKHIREHGVSPNVE